jgi:hypothetical protein
MDLGRIMKRAVRRVANLLGAYARREGWWASANFRIYYRVDDAWGSLHFIFISDGFEGRDEFENYESVMSYLRRRLSDDPDLFGAIHLVVETFNQVAEGGLYAIGDDYQLAKPRDLAVLTLNKVGPLIAAYADQLDWHEDDFRLLFKPESASDKLRMVLLLDDPEASTTELRDKINNFLERSLSDEPDLLYTLDLEVTGAETPGAEDMKEWIDSQYPGYRSLSLA